MAGLRLDFLHLLILFGLSNFFSLLRFLDFLNRFWTFWKKWTKTGPIRFFEVSGVKAFALTGRIADCYYTQGAALG